jgi:hypothetical protein
VPLKVNKLWSAKTQLTYDYYSLPVCAPTDPTRDAENIGQVLAGDRLTSSDYQLLLGSDTRCNVLCDKTFDQEALDLFTERIASEYTVSWVVDGLPAAVRMYEEGAPERVHLERGELPLCPTHARTRTRAPSPPPPPLQQSSARAPRPPARPPAPRCAGFPLGFQAVPPGSPSRRAYLFNHVQFIIGYHQEHDDHPEAGPLGGEAGAEVDHSKDVDPADAKAANEAGIKYRIVGFEVEPYTGAPPSPRHCRAARAAPPLLPTSAPSPPSSSLAPGSQAQEGQRRRGCLVGQPGDVQRQPLCDARR